MKKPKKSSTPKPPKPSPELQRAFDRFPQIIKLKEKAAREKKKVIKNFLSVKKEVYK